MAIKCPKSNYKFLCGKNCPVAYGMVICWYNGSKLIEIDLKKKMEEIDHLLTYGE